MAYWGRGASCANPFPLFKTRKKPVRGGLTPPFMAATVLKRVNGFAQLELIYVKGVVRVDKGLSFSSLPATRHQLLPLIR